MNTYEEGFLMGLLVGEGYFGGDKVQAEVNINMSIRHQKTLAWCLRMIPGSKLYGPYHHCNRNYLKYMVRGKALRSFLLPVLLEHFHSFDDQIRYRIQKMIEDYELCDQSCLDSLLPHEDSRT